MANKEYFYLAGADKKGPYSKEEIINLKLPNDTLIYFDEINKWVPYEDLEDFKLIIEEKQDEPNIVKTKKKIILTNYLVLYSLSFQLQELPII